MSCCNVGEICRPLCGFSLFIRINNNQLIESRLIWNVATVMPRFMHLFYWVFTLSMYYDDAPVEFLHIFLNVEYFQQNRQVCQCLIISFKVNHSDILSFWLTIDLMVPKVGFSFVTYIHPCIQIHILLLGLWCPENRRVLRLALSDLTKPQFFIGDNIFTCMYSDVKRFK